ncbi:hypothetical protein A2707_02750 [Candidatus Saccharibacteria bacterium RIFCSPHIGHO2_01_FULL_45_15]|nr:MAG: hypothetical protein A2707_02750 [Candidatus Saccharibacteria bacterium RIFCSPHIGHO2_01_FULL_45_15]OGL31847.1 MAG: hypothetical protein A3E76_03340 [Candidatus Saccharibacteria bacterium RIFCSPHIGHO2_12_FULL_44_22]
MNVLTQFAQSIYGNDYSNYDSSSISNEDAATALAIGGTLFIVTMVIAVIIYVVHAFLLSRIFKKAGTPEWIAWVPFYNSWKLLELGNQPGFWAVLAIIPIVNIASAVFMYIAMYHIGLKLQKEGWFVLLAIFVPLVWLIWLGFDSSKWNDTPDQVTPTTPPQTPVQPTV